MRLLRTVICISESIFYSTQSTFLCRYRIATTFRQNFNNNNFNNNNYENEIYSLRQLWVKH